MPLQTFGGTRLLRPRNTDAIWKIIFPTTREREKSFVDGEGVIVLLMDFLCTMTDMLESECKVHSFWSATSSSHNSLKNKIHFSTLVREAYSLTCVQMFPAIVSSHIYVVVFISIISSGDPQILCWPPKC